MDCIGQAKWTFVMHTISFFVHFLKGEVKIMKNVKETNWSKEFACYKKKMDEQNQLVNKLLNGEELSLEESENLIVCRISIIREDYGEEAIFKLINKLDNELPSWSDYSDKYPNNPYLSGFTLNGKNYACHYSGVMGCFWNFQDDKFILKW